MMKKITALVLALLIGLFAVSCSMQEEGVPEDMQSATLAGEPFRLYVPSYWVTNTVSGISSAYYTAAQKSLVTARYYTPADPAMTLDQYMDLCEASYASLKDYTLLERTSAILGGKDARLLNYKMTDDGVELTCRQIVTLHEGDMISLSLYCVSSLWELVSADFEEKIVANFALTTKTEPQGEELTDSKTPEGMEIASEKHLEYRLYVPKTWVCDAESGASEAYYPESGRSNISVTSYPPEESISVTDHFARCENEYKTLVPGYERLSEAQGTVAGRTAYSYTYRAVVDGVEFRIMQTLFAYDSMIYSITYTALAENFDLHMADVEAVLNAFRFR